eukprot:TRINITY_DN14560_c0_g1_i4.p1 TRINITY_DN14560_c0_g1~~TRINITY_DN14560_c0_g1_i4.p1  ORF type:complete len:302 (-),score=41.89 TRINITY_DN14560_c0_g1_i4:362-1267(-)
MSSSNSYNNRVQASGGNRSGFQDDWGDWGGKQKSSMGSISSSQYNKSALEASAADKDNFFARKQQENQTRSDSVPPSQGGKYVGFGSTPDLASSTRQKASLGTNLDDVTGMLSKGFSQLSTVATSAVKTGASSISNVVKDKQLQEKLGSGAKAVAERSKELGSQGWSGLKNIYANVAGKVETLARDQGYNVNLGAQHVKESASMPNLRSQSQQRIMNDNYAYGSHTGTGTPNGGFSGFDQGGDDDWDDWNQTAASKKNDFGQVQQRNNNNFGGWDNSNGNQQIQSRNTKKDDDNDDDWGKW